MRLRVVAIVAAASVLAGLSTARLTATKDARNMWKDVLKKCANTDVLGKRILYVGPSNNVGLGSIWREAQGGYRLVRRFEDSGASATAQAQTIQQGSLAPCIGNSTTSKKINATGVLQSLVTPFSGNAAVDFSRTNDVTVSVTSWAWDQLVEGNFKDLVQMLPPLGYRQDLTQNFVAGRVLKISGLKADLKFSGANAVDIGTKYKNGVDVGAGLKAQMQGGNTLHVESTGTVFLVIEPYKYVDVGFQSAGVQKFLLPVKDFQADAVVQ